MKGLLLKDWYQVCKNMRTMYLTVAIMMAVWLFSTSGSYVFPVSYAAIFLGILPVSLLTYDQNSGWVEYGWALPVSKKLLVAEKYLVGLLCAGAAVAMDCLLVAALLLHRGEAPDSSVLFLLGNSISTILLMNGICLPLMYRFGAEKARMIYLMMFAGLGAFLGGGSALTENITGTPGELRLTVGLPVALLAVAALVYAASWRLSVVWYGKYKK